MVRRMLERIHGRCCCCWVESSLLLLLVQERSSRRGHVEACSTRVLFILDLKRGVYYISTVIVRYII